jgi:RsiW-degrading membrane proteinase PrsW (M82 family)
MFDSLAGGFLPTSILAALASVVLTLVRREVVAIILAAFTAVAISYLWFHLPEFLWPAEHTDPQGGWDLVATFFWSIVAVPSAVVTQLVTRHWHASRKRR